MAKINLELLISEKDQWTKLITITGESIIPKFGHYMNVKYNFNDDELASTTDVHDAYFRIKEKHVGKI